MFIGLAIVVAGVLLAMATSAQLGHKTALRNHAQEWAENTSLEELTDPRFRWAIVHIRDDIGSIYNTALITNGLLGGVLGALIAQLIH